MCGPAHGLDPPHLHRRLGLRGLRRREPAVLTSTAAQVLQQRLGLSDDELCQALDLSPLELIGTSDFEHRPQLALLLAITDGLDDAVLRRWVRTTRGGAKPIAALLERRFGAFEDAVEDLRERGLVIGG